MKNNTTNLVPTGHEVGTVTTVSGEILTSFFMSFYTSKKYFIKISKIMSDFVAPNTEYMEGKLKIL